MPQLLVTGGIALRGDIEAPGAKNAVLPILAASLLSRYPVRLLGCPRLVDVDNMIDIMRSLGCDIEWQGDTLLVDTRNAQQHEMPEHLLKAIRSSIFLLGPMLARFKKAVATFPGGCEIGRRPIDLHLFALRALGARIDECGSMLCCFGEKLIGAHIHLDYPSVGATENAMMAAVAAQGKTVINNAAREPEIVDLQVFLQKLGYEVRGAGTSSITVMGGCTPMAAEHRVMKDRIAAGTYLCAAAITGGDVRVNGISPEPLLSLLSKLRECGATIESDDDFIRVIGPKRPNEIKRVETSPYPGFPTDMQAQLFAVCSVAKGTSVIIENVFESRFRHAGELMRMGADCTISDRTAIIRGVAALAGTEVGAWDLRGGAALVLAGLRAKGQTLIRHAERIDRGYESIERDLNLLGASIKRIQG